MATLQQLAATLCPVGFILLLLVFSPPTSAQPASYTDLSNDVALFGSLPANSTAYYRFVSPTVSYQQTALISVSAELGFPLLYVSLTAPTPSASSFDYFASWQTGGVVSIVTQQPPYSAYVAVTASPYSHCNYTVLVTAYDTAAKQLTPVLLSEAEPVASAIAAGEYRYFTYVVPANVTSATVSLTETYGQSWLLLNSPNTTQLPTIERAEYTSVSTNFPLVALRQPINGTWTIGVWSNSSSAFAIIAATASRTIPMQLGVAYPGSVESRESHYYSIYLDPLLTTNSTGVLDLELYSLLGDADLYCSDTNTQPTQSTFRWWSQLEGHQDTILISPATMQADTIYCCVYGYGPASYIFSALYGGGSTIQMTAGETQLVQSALGRTQLYSFVFPATDFLITTSIVSEVGTTSIQAGGYGDPPSYFIRSDEAAVQTEQIYASSLCGTSNENTIPGSSPPLCQLQMSVYTPSGGVYSITATSDPGQLVALTAGQPTEWEASDDQSAYFSFIMSDSLSNVTVIVTVTNGGSGLKLQAGLIGYSSLNKLWTVQQQPDSNVLVFQLDWTDPQLAERQFRAGGTYGLVLSASSGPVTFSIVYTITNSSIYSNTIVRLLDGQPQESIVVVNGFGFYYFQPPAAGWPYVVTVDLEWLSGYGNLRLASTEDGPQVGPLPSGRTMLSTDSGSFTIGPNEWFVCDPIVSPRCGYSISVQIAPQSQEQGVYTLTMTSSRWVQSLYPNSAPSGGSLGVLDSDYYKTNLALSASMVNAEQMYALTVLSGQVTVFASNITSATNASTAQLVWAALSSSSVLSVKLPALRSLVFITVFCSSTDGSPCVYTLQTQTYYDGPILKRHNLNEDPTLVLLPSGGILTVAVSLSTYFNSRFGYVLLQAEAVVGTVELYASCVTNIVVGTILPNETSHTWQATSSPAVIELDNFNITNAACNFMLLGVRATGDQPALASVGMSAAGVEQHFVGGTLAGFISPNYPVSYYRYELTDGSADVVLAFTVDSSSSSNCTTDQISLLVSESNVYPDASVPTTYNFSGKAVMLSPGMPIDLTVTITNYTKPLGALRPGHYFLAAQSRVAGLTCRYQLQGSSHHQRSMKRDDATWQSASQHSTSYFSFSTAYNSSTSFALQLFVDVDVLFLYVGVNSSPTINDPSTYLLAATYNTTGATGSYVGMWVADPVYMPASACSAYTALGETCTIVFLAVTSSPSSSYKDGAFVTPMTSANAVWLRGPDQPTTAPNATASSTTYQFNLAATPQAVTVQVNSSSGFTLSCSYQYVKPIAQFYDWRTTHDASSGRSVNSTLFNSTQLSFTWGTAQMHTNPNTQYAATPTICYCTVETYGPYTISYSTSPLSSPSPSSDEGLSSGALAAAVVVPIAAVLVLVAVLLWLRRSRQWSGNAAADKLDDRTHRRLDESRGASNEVSLADLSGSRAKSGQLMESGWHSDRG